jgi:hypothetical protein
MSALGRLRRVIPAHALAPQRGGYRSLLGRLRRVIPAHALAA